MAKFDVQAIYCGTAPSKKAVFVQIEEEEFAVPCSQILKGSDIFEDCPMERGDEGTLLITEWLARKKGWL